jgi:NifB/MoaA-like Fe-S oxidoreductase
MNSKQDEYLNKLLKCENACAFCGPDLMIRNKRKEEELTLDIPVKSATRSG